jgi:hypothetical protein
LCGSCFVEIRRGIFGVTIRQDSGYCRKGKAPDFSGAFLCLGEV